MYAATLPDPNYVKAEPVRPTTAEILRLVNEERKLVGVKPLKTTEILQNSAHYKSKDMALRDYYSHEDPDTGLKNGMIKAGELGARCSLVGENLAHGYHKDASKTVVAAWKASPTHYKNMIDPTFTHTGIAISGEYITQHFCGS